MKALLGVVVGLVGLSGSALWAQDTNTGPLGLPLSSILKDKCGLDDEQVKKVDGVYADYKQKADDATKKMKDADDKKAAGQELRTLRTEIVGKLKDIGKDDDQKKKIEDACARQRKKKNNNNN
jgi:hypothetical protein